MEIIAPQREQLNSFVIANNGSFQQSWQWGELQEQMQRPVRRFLVLENNEPIAAATFVKHVLLLGQYYWLCPKGPVIDQNQKPKIKNQKFWKELKERLGGVFIRIEPEVPATFNFQLSTFNLRRAPKDHNPRATIVIDLTKSEDELLAKMHPKTRYNIKLAEKKELRIKNPASPAGRQESREDFETVWKLFQETAKRDKFYLHPKEYYEKLLALAEIRLFLAYFSQKLIAGAIVSFFGKTASYLHGASDYDFRQLMAPYLLHWEIMRHAKKQGMEKYDFGGVAPKNSKATHPWSGITRFKQGFGGEYVEYAGSYDYVMDKMWYGIYKVARKIF
jgi:lipid II:glycine glycyltransferase (peptidoglycan interpeptide bridge formation enzyme)